MGFAGCHTSGVAPSDAGAKATGTALAPSWTTPIDGGAPAVLAIGHNTVWSRGGLGMWNDTTHAVDPTVLSLTTALAPPVLRFPGGTRAMRYHFAQAIGPLAARVPQCDPFTGTTDPTGYGIDEFMSVAETLGADVTLVMPWVDGSPQEFAAFVAYVNADPSSTVPIGKDLSGMDWGTAGSWGAERATNGHAAPYGVKFVEIGNETYSGLPVGPPTSCGRPSQFVQDERWVNGTAIPTTAKDYAGQLALTGALIRAIDPSIQIGAPVPAQYDGVSDAAQALGDVDSANKTSDPWAPRLLSDAASAFDFFVIHPYDFTSSDGRLQLAQEARKVMDDLHGLAPDKRIAVTEYGFLENGDTALNAVVSADMARIALEEGAAFVTRHLLLEDDLDDPFATCALIGGADHRLSPAYGLEEELARVVPGASRVAVSSPETDVEFLPLVEADGSLALVSIDRRDQPDGGTAFSVSLPAGTWIAATDTMAPSSVYSTTAAFGDGGTVSDVTGTLEVTLPPNGIAVSRMKRE
jgi:hypothetical protein